MATEYKAVGKLYQIYPIWSFKMVYPLLDSDFTGRTHGGLSKS
jgi:hypothetical protein